MGIAQQFETIIKSQLRAHAAWMPVTNSYRLGDFGLISEGIFNKMGNISDEFNVTFQQSKGPDASIDFVSSSTTIFNFVGAAKVDVIPQGAINARVSFKFEKEKSLLIKAPVISVSAIDSVNAVLTQLKANEKWENHWCIVYQTYQAEDAVIISTKDGGTEINFSGDATALQKLNLGNAGVQLNTNKEVGLKIQGKAGVIALGLVKIKKNVFGKEKTDFLGEAETAEVEDLNDKELEDDL